MIRTRDFLLFVVIFVFILTGIVFTVSGDLRTRTVVTEEPPQLAVIEGMTVPADSPTSYIDRDANLAALRERILRGDGEIIEGAPVFTSVDTPTSTPEEEVLSEGSPMHSAQYCSEEVYSATALLWGASRAKFQIAEGARLVVLEKQKKVKNGSTTTSTTTTHTALQLPLTPTPTGTLKCLDSKYIGIALDGSLIHNEEAWRYRSFSDESVIGYARDGFPIYGPKSDETVLDACGGYDGGGGYRYHVRENDLFVIGCYVGQPTAFID